MARASASRWLVGSSSTSRSGAASFRPASRSRVCSPPLKSAVRRSSARSARPTSARAACIRSSSVQSASAMSSSEPSPASTRCRTARGSATPSVSATVSSSAGVWACASQPTVPARATAPSAGSARPATRRSNVVLPTPLRPTTAVRSRPKASVRLSKRPLPSGVRAATLLSVTSANADRFGLGLSEDIGEHEQRHGKGETDFQGADHDRRASSLMRWLSEGWGRTFRNATPNLRRSFRNAATGRLGQSASWPSATPLPILPI